MLRGRAPTGPDIKAQGRVAHPGLARRPSIRSLTRRNPNGVAHQSPGSRSTLGRHRRCSIQSLSLGLQGSVVWDSVAILPRVRFATLGFVGEPLQGLVGVSVFHRAPTAPRLTQGASRDPGLCCAAPLGQPTAQHQNLQASGRSQPPAIDYGPTRPTATGSYAR
jgi:hypothetical protein